MIFVVHWKWIHRNASHTQSSPTKNTPSMFHEQNKRILLHPHTRSTANMKCCFHIHWVTAKSHFSSTLKTMWTENCNFTRWCWEQQILIIIKIKSDTSCAHGLWLWLNCYRFLFSVFSSVCFYHWTFFRGDIMLCIHFFFLHGIKFIPWTFF